MNDESSAPKEIPEQLTLEQLQEKLKSGDFKVEMAPHEYVGFYPKEIGDLLLTIGKYMSSNPGRWARNCFVTDMSTLSDFFANDDEGNEDVEAISKELGFHVDRQMYLYEIAARMHGIQ